MTDEGTSDRQERLRRAIQLRRSSDRLGSPSGGALPGRPPHRPALLSGVQRSLWLEHRMAPESAAYTLASAFRFRGDLDEARLEGAFRTVVGRHRILRSSFVEREGRVVQDIQRAPEVALEVLEVEAPEEAAVEEARRPFDLTRGPLARLVLLRGPGGARILLLLLHHIVADQRSLARIWSEVATAYGGRRLEAEAARQYDDWVAWSDVHEADRRSDDLAFWGRRLDPAPEPLELPFERPGPRRRSGPGRLLRSRLESGVRDRIVELAARIGTTPFAVAAFAFRLLLDRYVDGRGIAFGTPATVRSHPATADMIGYFLNPVVVSIPLDEGGSVEAAVRAFATEFRASLTHGSVPFPTLVERLARPGPERHPFFQAMLVHQRRPEPFLLGPVELAPVELDLGAAKFDLTLFFSEGQEAVELGVEYRIDRFDEVWMRSLMAHYEGLLRRIVEDSSAPCAELALPTGEEAERLDVGWQGPALEEAAPTTLPEAVLAQARRAPDATAVTCDGKPWSYRQLEEASLEVMEELRSMGVGPGDRVGLFVERSAEMIGAVVGILRSGAAYVPVDPEYPAARTTAVLSDAEVTAVVTTPASRGRVPDGPWTLVVCDRSGGEPLRGDGRSCHAALDDPAYLLYTSGSTGRPKGVVVTHANLAASNAARRQVYSGWPERFLLLPSIAFDSSVAGLFCTLAAGGTVVVPTDAEAGDPRLLTKRIEADDVTGLLCVPSLYTALLRAGDARLGSLRTAIVAGERCPPALVADHFARLPGTRLFNEYGPTEATVWASVHEVEGGDAVADVPIGRPIPGVRIRVRDRAGRPVPPGVPGEAWISGPTVADGYWRRPERTRERFVADPDAPVVGGRAAYRTGDRMAWTVEGRLAFLGRLDEQIKLRGFRIEPGEVEATLAREADVAEAAVVVREVAASGGGNSGSVDGGPLRQLVAFVRPEGPVRDAEKRWRASLATRLPSYMVPARIVALEEFPRLPNGKLDRERLARMPLARSEHDAADGTPRTNLERALSALWSGLLGVDDVRVTDNFFEIGGHSLLVVEMATALNTDFGVELSAAEVFQYPTIRELSQRMGAQRTPDFTKYAHLFPLQPSGAGSPFIVAVPHVFASTFTRRFRGERPVYGLRGVGLRTEGNSGRWSTMDDLSRDLLDEIVHRFPGRSFLVAGYSFGATMAFDLVRLMEERGVDVDALYLIAPMPLDTFGLGPMRLQLQGLREPLTDLSVPARWRRWFAGLNPFDDGLYRRMGWALGVRPVRRILALVGRVRRSLGLPLTPRILHADVRAERFRLHGRYRPRPIRTPTVIFNPEEPATDAAATWRPWFDGPLTVQPTPDPHLGADEIRRTEERILEHLAVLDPAATEDGGGGA